MTSPITQLTREKLLAIAPAPEEAIAHGVGTDIEGDLEVLWALATILRPRVTVEIGTRQGVSTKTLARAIKTNGLLPMWTIDPDPTCRSYLKDLGIDQEVYFVAATGEYVYTNRGFAKQLGEVDLLFVDTDPHTYDQTKLWLDTWVTRIRPGGCAAFHDIVAAREEIQVAQAVRDWVSNQRLDQGLGRLAGNRDYAMAHPEDRESEDWIWREYPSNKGGYGIGVLWRR